MKKVSASFGLDRPGQVRPIFMAHTVLLMVMALGPFVGGGLFLLSMFFLLREELYWTMPFSFFIGFYLDAMTASTHYKHIVFLTIVFVLMCLSRLFFKIKTFTEGWALLGGILCSIGLIAPQEIQGLWGVAGCFLAYPLLCSLYQRLLFGDNFS